MRQLSVIIPNYNYADFVGVAIQSALNLDWPDVEVIVVDDGSTDDSGEVIDGFADRVRIVRQANAGPRVACNAGYAISHGDVVIFLDSDDVLDPSIAREIDAVWRTGISKVQVQMRRIDRNGLPTGSAFPDYRDRPTPEQIRYWMTETSAYPTPPGSGNAYSREFLERIFPLDDRCGDATDSACLAAAPFLGDVVTIPKPLVDYRVHGNNRSSLAVDPTRFTRQIQRAAQRERFALDVSGRTEPPMNALFRGRHLLQLRVAEHRIHGGATPIPDDGSWRMFGDCFATLFAPGPEPARARVANSCWCLAALVAPRPLALRLIRGRFSQHTPVRSRPRVVKRLTNPKHRSREAATATSLTWVLSHNAVGATPTPWSCRIACTSLSHIPFPKADRE